jgi:hypothetical protein
MTVLFHAPDDFLLNSSDDTLREIFEKLLEIRKAVEAGVAIDPVKANILSSNALSLFRELMRPISTLLKIELMSEDNCYSSVEECRRTIAQTVRSGLPFPRRVAHFLANQLEALNLGYTHDIFQKTPGRRGTMPHLIAEGQLKLLMWIRYQHGRGQKVADAESEVAGRIGRTHEAISKWPKELSRLYGEAHFRTLLNHAEQIGRWEIAGTSPTLTERDPKSLEVFFSLERDIESLAEGYREAITLREEPEPDEGS